MKFAISFLVILAFAAAGYFLHPLIYEAVEKGKPRDTVLVVQKTVTVDESGNATTTSTAAVKEKSAAEKLLDKMKGKMPDVPLPVTSTTPTTGAQPSGEVEDEWTRKYPLPKFKPLEDITKNWTYVPSSVFPRRVKAKVPIDFILAAGKTTVPAGMELLAKGMPSGMVIVSRSETDTLEAQVPLPNTDLQEIVSRLYDLYKQKAIARVMKRREAAKYAAEHPAPPPPPENERAKLAGAEPAPGVGGQVPEMVADLNSGKVTEFTAANIIRWGPMEFQMDGAKGFWACTVVVRMQTIFGDVDTEVTAYIANGKVVKWFYAGSKEPVN